MAVHPTATETGSVWPDTVTASRVSWVQTVPKVRHISWRIRLALIYDLPVSCFLFLTPFSTFSSGHSFYCLLPPVKWDVWLLTGDSQIFRVPVIIYSSFSPFFCLLLVSIISSIFNRIIVVSSVWGALNWYQNLLFIYRHFLFISSSHQCSFAPVMTISVLKTYTEF